MNKSGRKSIHKLLTILQVEDDYESAFAELVKEINESVQKDVINEAADIVNRGNQICFPIYSM